MNLTPQEIQSIIQLISRANIQGNEAIAVAQLQMKLQQVLESQQQLKKEKIDEKTDTKKTSG